MTARVDAVVTATGDDEDGMASHAWLVGDDEEVIVVNPGAEDGAEAVLEAVGEREVLAVICTHGDSEHCAAAPTVAERDEAPVALHPKDRVLWDVIHEDEEPDISMEGGGVFEVADSQLRVLHTPGHTRGGVCLYSADLEVVFTGATLAKGGPEIVESKYFDYSALLTSVGEKLLDLPAATRVLPTHGEETTVGDEEPNFDAWVSRAE